MTMPKSSEAKAALAGLVPLSLCFIVNESYIPTDLQTGGSPIH